MNTIRPINEELTELHKPVIVEDNDSSALDGFRVTNSGSVMVPTGSNPAPFVMQRSSSNTSALSSSYSSSASNPPPSLPDPYNPAYFSHPSSFGTSDPYQVAQLSHSFNSLRTDPRSSIQQHQGHYRPRSLPQQYSSSPQMPPVQMSQPYPYNYGQHPMNWSNY